jgi:hypothetical protein
MSPLLHKNDAKYAMILGKAGRETRRRTDGSGAMKKNMTLAGAAALALTLGGGAAAAQAKAPARHHTSKAVVADHATREISPLDWLIPGPSETSAPGLGLVTDLIEELLGQGGLLNGG